MEPETETLKVYSSYTEAQKRATKKYREQNKEKVNAQRKKYYDERKAKDPEFLSYKREKAKEYYIKKKGILTDNQFEVLTDDEPKEELVVITEPKVQEEIITVEPKTPKVIRKPRVKKEIPKKENIKPEDLEDIKMELIKALGTIKIEEEIEEDIIVPKTPRKRSKSIISS